MKLFLRAGITLCATALLCVSFAQSWSSAFKISPTDTVYGTPSITASCTDTAGNFYVTGSYKSKTKFSSTISLDTMYGITGGKDANKPIGFVAKFNSSGVCQWAKRFGSADTMGRAYGNAIALDSLGNLWIGGAIRATGSSTGTTLRMFDTTLSSFTLPSGGSSLDAVVIKISSSTGKFSWIKFLNKTKNDDAITGICSDAHNNVYATGYFQSLPPTHSPDAKPFNFDFISGTKRVGSNGIPSYRTSVRGISASEGFALRINKDTTCSWLSTFQGKGFSDKPTDIVYDKGGIFVVGNYTDTLRLITTTFDSLAVAVVFESIAGKTGANAKQNFFIAKFDTASSDTSYTINNVTAITKYRAVPRWIKGIGGVTGDQTATAAVAAGNGVIYVAGTFAGHSSIPLSFGNGHSLTDLDSTIYSSAFLLKIDGSDVSKTAGFTATWAKKISAYGARYGCMPYDITLDGSKNIILGGAIGAVQNGGISFASKAVTTAGQCDAFIYSYDPDGAEKWSITAGGQYNDSATMVAASGTSNVFIGGVFKSHPASFGALSLPNMNTRTTSSNQFTGFYATINQSSAISIDLRSAGLHTPVTTLISSNRLKVSIKGIYGTAPVMISLINAQGRTAISTRLSPVGEVANGAISLKHVPAGSYIVRVTAGSRTLYTGQCLVAAR